MCSSDLHISPLHREFHSPLPSSSVAVSQALPWLSQGLSPKTYYTAYAPFTPSKSGQRSPPTYYRGCWHVVSRGLFLRYRPSSSLRKEVYNPKAFFPHAASLRQAFAHCARFPAAASRRSGARVSVPLWLVVLSDQLPVIGLVSHYLSNYHDRTRAPPKAGTFTGPVSCTTHRSHRLCGLSPPFGGLSPSSGQVAHVFLSRPPLRNINRSRYSSFDLHALSAPPAFVLSQDQTRIPVDRKASCRERV